MRIKIEKEDIIQSNIEISRALINEALFISEDEVKAKKLFMAYKGISQTLRLMGVNPQDIEK